MAFVNKKHVMKTARKGQGKAVMYAHFVISRFKAMLYYKNKALQFKKFVWALRVEAF